MGRPSAVGSRVARPMIADEPLLRAAFSEILVGKNSRIVEASLILRADAHNLPEVITALAGRCPFGRIMLSQGFIPPVLINSFCMQRPVSLDVSGACPRQVTGAGQTSSLPWHEDHNGDLCMPQVVPFQRTRAGTTSAAECDDSEEAVRTDLDGVGRNGVLVGVTPFGNIIVGGVGDRLHAAHIDGLRRTKPTRTCSYAIDVVEVEIDLPATAEPGCTDATVARVATSA